MELMKILDLFPTKKRDWSEISGNPNITLEKHYKKNNTFFQRLKIEYS